MRKVLVLAILVLAAAPVAVVAQDADLFDAGSWEFGGSFMYTYMPSQPIFSDQVSELDKKDGYHFLEINGRVGIFPVDRLSINISPAFTLLYRENSEPTGDDKSTTALIDIGAGAMYYIPLGGPSVMSVGAGFSVGFMPGIDGLSDGLDDPDDSFAMSFSLEPLVSYYLFVSDRLAPYAELGFRLGYIWEILNQDGSDVAYPSDYSIFDDVTGRVRLTIGLKYFLLPGSRSYQEPESSVFDIITDGRLIN